MVTPFGNAVASSSGFTDGTTMHVPPCCQLAGVATRLVAVSWSESRTRISSGKFRPVVAGYRMLSLSFLSGPTMKTARHVIGMPLDVVIESERT